MIFFIRFQPMIYVSNDCTIYQQTKTPNPKFFIQSSETLPIERTGTHRNLPTTTNFYKIRTHIYNLIHGPSNVGKKLYDHKYLFSFYDSYIIHSSKLQIFHMYSIHIFRK